MKPTNPSPIAQEYMQRGRSETCPIVDMHGHMGTFGGAFMPSAPSIERMRQAMKRAGVQLLVCSHHAMAYDLDLGNATMQEIIDKYPDDYLGYWVIDPHDPAKLARDLRNFEKTRGFVGFKLWADYHLVPITSPKYTPAMQYANERGLLVMVHTWGGSRYNAPEMVGELGSRYPKARFVMAHSGHGDFETSVHVAQTMPNVYLDLCSVPNPHDFSLMPGGSLMGNALNSPQVNGIVEYFVESAGSKKVIFGTDQPWYSQHYHAGAVVFAHITDEARHDILHRNAKRLLGDRWRPPR